MTQENTPDRGYAKRAALSARIMRYSMAGARLDLQCSPGVRAAQLGYNCEPTPLQASAFAFRTSHEFGV